MLSSGTYERALEKARPSKAYQMDFQGLGVAVFLSGCAAFISRFRPLLKGGKPPHMLWTALVFTEAAWGQCSPHLLLERRRPKRVVWARFRVCRTLHMMGYGLSGIAAVAGTHHSSVLHSIRRVENYYSPTELALMRSPQ